MDEDDAVTIEQILERWGEAERRARQERRPTISSALRAAPREARLPQTHELERGQLWLTISGRPGNLTLHFEAQGREWQGAVLHCQWGWESEEQPGGIEERTLIVRLGDQPVRERYQRILRNVQGNLFWAPAWVRLQPGVVQPEFLEEAWEESFVKQEGLTLEALQRELCRP